MKALIAASLACPLSLVCVCGCSNHDMLAGSDSERHTYTPVGQQPTTATYTTTDRSGTTYTYTTTDRSGTTYTTTDRNGSTYVASTDPNGTGYTPTQPSSEPTEKRSTLSPRTDPGERQTTRTSEPNPGNRPPTTAAASTRSMTTDSRVLAFMHAKNQEEIKLGRLAADNGHAELVKQYGRELARDHTENDTKVMELAKTLGITVMEPDQYKEMVRYEKNITTPPKDPVTELGSVGGTEFDRVFAEKMQSAHRKVIRQLEEWRPQISDSRLRDLVSQTIPALRHHEEMATKILDDLAPVEKP